MLGNPPDKFVQWIVAVRFRKGANNYPIVIVDNIMNELKVDPDYEWSRFVHPDKSDQPFNEQVRFLRNPPTVFLGKNCFTIIQTPHQT